MPTLPDLPLACPRCRATATAGRAAGVRPIVTGRGLRCPACGTAYPVVDGIPCLPPDVDAFLAAQSGFLDPRDPPCDPSEGDGCCRRASSPDPASGAFREAVLAGQHAAAHHPESCRAIGLADELAGNVATIARLAALLRAGDLPGDAPFPAILDAGCGPGRLSIDLADAAPSGSVGMDLRVRPLRLAARVATGRRSVVPFRVEGCRFEPLEVAPIAPRGPVRFVQGDILDPPFAAASFAAVAAVSLLDTVPDPRVALGQMDALLAPGGLLLLATPWQWEPSIVPPGRWWSTAASTSADALRAALEGRDPSLPHLSYDVLHDDRDGLPWSLPGHARLVFRYRLHVVLARRRRDAA